MKEKLKKILEENRRIRKIAGVILIFVGLIALLTPFTPGSWIALIGLELLGIRFLFWERIKDWFKKTTIMNMGCFPLLFKRIRDIIKRCKVLVERMF
ncbi:MAG: hypothetical protein EXS69_00775 [Candidatus Zambryskibacteria bacterium]|nr:hypothetical protein [Candidatus Zambryskibacteria bacterium]